LSGVNYPDRLTTITLAGFGWKWSKYELHYCRADFRPLYFSMSCGLKSALQLCLLVTITSLLIKPLMVSDKLQEHHSMCSHAA